jgi:hypothetical protein
MSAGGKNMVFQTEIESIGINSKCALTIKLVDWSLYLYHCYPRRSSTPQSETESGECSDDGELSDLTPCNPSPSLSQLLSWSGCTAGEIATDFSTITEYVCVASCGDPGGR